MSGHRSPRRVKTPMTSSSSRAGRLWSGRPGVEINSLGPDDWFGEIGLLRRAPRTATVEATAPSEVWRIPGDVFLAAVTSSSVLPDSLTETMQARLAQSDAVRGF